MPVNPIDHIEWDGFKDDIISAWDGLKRILNCWKN